jgi:hypothetical protein
LSKSSSKNALGIRDPGSGKKPFRIPDPGSRGQKGTGSRIRIRNTAIDAEFDADFGSVKKLAKKFLQKSS